MKVMQAASRFIVVAVLYVILGGSAGVDIWGDSGEWKDLKHGSYLFDNQPMFQALPRTSASPSSSQNNTKQDSQKSEGKAFVDDLMKVIHQRQHPLREKCSSSRLLVLHMKTDSLEGLCSITKQIVVGLSIAMHSNRTLIFGLAPQFLYEATQDVWGGNKKKELTIGGIPLSCPPVDPLVPTGAAYDCFFQPLSTCSLADVSTDELEKMSESGYDENARVMLLDVRQNGRKSVSLYHPPQRLFDHILSARSYSEETKAVVRAQNPQFWAAAVSAYAFRLKPSLTDAFAALHQQVFQPGRAIWGLHIRHGDVKAMQEMIRQKRVFEFEHYFAAARDHSHRLEYSPDLLLVATDSDEAEAVPERYGSFLRGEDSRVSRGRQSLPTRNDDPNEAADDDEEDEVETGKENGDDDDSMDDLWDDSVKKPKVSRTKVRTRTPPPPPPATENSSRRKEQLKALHNDWYGTPRRNKLGEGPEIFVVNNTLRYRSDYGFVVAASNACIDDPTGQSENGKFCNIPHHHSVVTESHPYGKPLPRGIDGEDDTDDGKGAPGNRAARPERLMRLLLEAIEDLYLLSRSDVLVAAGSSHFSTLAATLIWARIGCRNNVSMTTVLLDEDTMVTGDTATAFLQGTNLWNATYYGSGAERWSIHTTRFVSGIEGYSNSNPSTNVPGDITVQSLGFSPWSAENRMSIGPAGVPRLPPKIFYREALTWYGGEYKPIWPGSCPAFPPPSPLDYEQISRLVMESANRGADHFSWFHMPQTQLCWRNALAAAEVAEEQIRTEVKKKKVMNEKLEFLRMAKEVVQDNLKVLQQVFMPYLLLAKKRHGAKTLAATKQAKQQNEKFPEIVSRRASVREEEVVPQNADSDYSSTEKPSPPKKSKKATEPKKKEKEHVHSADQRVEETSSVNNLPSAPSGSKSHVDSESNSKLAQRLASVEAKLQETVREVAFLRKVIESNRALFRQLQDLENSNIRYGEKFEAD